MLTNPTVWITALWGAIVAQKRGIAWVGLLLLGVTFASFFLLTRW